MAASNYFHSINLCVYIEDKTSNQITSAVIDIIRMDYTVF